MTLTCILVDLENVQLKAPELAGLKRGEHLLKIFHGPSQNSFTAAMVRALQPLGDAVEYIQCEKAGPNALDFHLAFHLGRLTASQRWTTASSRATRALPNWWRTPRGWVIG